MKKNQETPTFVGKKIPQFEAEMTGGKTFSVKKMKGQAWVLYFYPRDATPGCTIQGHEFSKAKAAFKKMGYEVFGISRDTLKSHEKFKEKECYSIDLISDENEEICEKFGTLKEKNMYGKKVWGIERSTFVIDESGVCTHELRGVKAEGNAGLVLELLKDEKK